MAKGYRHLKDCAKLFAPFPWVEGRHIDLICDHLEAVEAGVCTRLCINIPPGYAKSYLCSRVFPVWCLLRHPEWEVLLTSYGDDLAQEHSSAARQFYRHWAPMITGATVDEHSQAVDRWLVDAGSAHLGGGMRACGIMSAVTGRRADVAIIDDPYKNWAEASSAAHRKTVVDNYRSAIRNRLRPGGRIVLIHTRWHKEDLTGTLEAEIGAGGEDWTFLRLAAQADAEHEDPLGRAPGEVLWPDYYTAVEVAQMKSAAGAFWESQHQQRPTEAKGKLFKRAWFRYFEVEGNWLILHAPEGDIRYAASDCAIVQTVDTNGSDKTSADYFVITTSYLCPGGEVAVAHVYREHLSVAEHLDALKRAYAIWSPFAICVENKTFGTNLIAAADAEGLPVLPTPADVDKITRAATILTKYKRGKVYHLTNGDWLGFAEAELLEFPGGHNDDVVDTLADAGIQSVELGFGGSGVPAVGGYKREGDTPWADNSWLR